MLTERGLAVAQNLLPLVWETQGGALTPRQLIHMYAVKFSLWYARYLHCLFLLENTIIHFKSSSILLTTKAFLKGNLLTQDSQKNQRSSNNVDDLNFSGI